MAPNSRIRMLLILSLAFCLADSMATGRVLVLDDRPEIVIQVQSMDWPVLAITKIPTAAIEVAVVWPAIISERTVHAYLPVSVPAIDEVPARCNSPPWVHRLKASK